MYDDCVDALLPARVTGRPRVSGSRGSGGLRVDDEVVESRSAILGCLAAWAQLVTDELGAARPVRRQPVDLATFLVNHLDWLVRHPACADLSAEVADVAARARRSAYVQPVLRIDLGRCVHPDCQEEMTTTPAGEVGRRGSEVRCAAGHVWLAHQWLQLARQIQRTRQTHAAGDTRLNRGVA
ncbi:hypothetical protein [Kitasatospora cathayae]|uniref:Uncharacterized protein n=1 Tax=Kitasatospora cathayae TaxID=3004092 RepID=A0ABY7Q6C9_9ACTN|nr:hypothetical protein [Kitasatospora sp. HUAS 3-15]WBP88262.1 hypothetical protein O1G21_22110 [Kitasatospora sp. HUAS 3-15]